MTSVEAVSIEMTHSRPWLEPVVLTHSRMFIPGAARPAQQNKGLSSSDSACVRVNADEVACGGLQGHADSS